jgi:hypothetical protein
VVVNIASCLAALAAVLVSALAAGSAGAQSAEQWFLFGRHGGCSEIAELRRKLPDLPEVRDPGAFVAYLKAKGMKYTEKPHEVPAGRAVEVQVPDAGLALLFATSQFCRSASGRQ